MKKVALCLAGAVGKKNGSLLRQGEIYREGGYVNYKAVYNSLKKHFFECNNDFEIDVFFHSWNEDLEEDLSRLYKPKAWLFENNNTYADEIQKKCKFNAEYGGISRSLSFKKVLELKEKYEVEQNFDYDVVFLFRYDVIIFKDIILNGLDLNNKVYMDTVPINSKLPGYPPSDNIFIMSTKTASGFKGLYDSIENGNPYVVHLWMTYFLIHFLRKEVLMIGLVGGVHYEQVRKLEECMVRPGKISLEVLKTYGITEEDILNCSAGWNPVNGVHDLEK